MTELYTLSQKRILSAIKYEFLKMNGNAFGQMEPLSEGDMVPLTDEIYQAMLDEW